MPATAADQASSPAPARAAGLVAAVLAFRRSDPAIRGRVMNRKLSLHSKAVKDAVPASLAPPPVSFQRPSIFAPPAEDELIHETAAVKRVPSGTTHGAVVPRSKVIPSGLRSYCDVIGDVTQASAASLGTNSGRILLQCVGMATGSWASLADEDDNSDEKELALMAPAASISSSQAAPCCLGHEAGESGGWHKVLPSGGPRRSASSTLALPHRPIPAWLFGRCCRCLAHGHRAAGCRYPLRCSRCLKNGHRVHDCRNAWHPLSSVACLAMPPVSCIGGEDHHAPIVSVSSDVVLQSAMATQVEQLEGFLVRIGRFVERAEAVLSKVSSLPATLLSTPAVCSPCEAGVDSMEDRGEELHGSFSPRVGDGLSPLSTSPSVSSIIEGEALDTSPTYP
jgi:hypothetical protein